MENYTIVTDSNADMLPGFAAKNGVEELELTYTMDGKTYHCNDTAFTRPEFYAKMRAGMMPITAQINPEDANEKLIPLLEAGSDVLCVMFSSGLSGTYNSVRIAAEELAPKYPARKIVVIDTLCASAGLGMLIQNAVDYRAAGDSLDEAAVKLRADAPRMAHLFTVDDLHHLRRGGRVSAATAVVGSMLNIKPVLHVDDEGHLTPTGKVRGRKASLLCLVDNMEKQFDRARCKRFAISHGDCLEDAEFVAHEIGKRMGIKDYSVNFVGPTIGAHSGPGTVALFFAANVR